MDPTLKLISLIENKGLFNFNTELKKLKYDNDKTYLPLLNQIPILPLKDDKSYYEIVDPLSENRLNGFSTFGNRNSMIFANIDAIFNLLERRGGLLGPQVEERRDATSYGTRGSIEDFTFCEVSEEPGTLTSYLQYRIPTLISWIFTGNLSNNKGKLKANIDRSRANLYTSLEAMKDEVVKINPFGIDLLFVDLNDTLLSTSIFLIVKNGGSLILKLSSIPLFPSLEQKQILSFILNNFEDIYIIKPTMSPRYSYDIYVVAKNKLPTMIDRIGNINNFIYFINSNSYNPNSYIKAADAYYNLPNQIIIPEYNYSYIFILFNIPGPLSSNVSNDDLRVKNIITTKATISKITTSKSLTSPRLLSSQFRNLDVTSRVSQPILLPSVPTSSILAKGPLSPGRSDITSSIGLMRNTISSINR